MTQTAAIFSKIGALRLELPSPDIQVMPGVRWGSVDAFPTPAYWVFQVVHRRVLGSAPQYKLGRSLSEEVGACLLGGHGIPASVGMAAYERLRTLGAFSDEPPSESQLQDWLTSPILVNGRPIKYRFANQKSKYLASALLAIRSAPATPSGRALRDWLKELPGIGYKTASWVSRNWLSADDVAILDIHILRFGQAIGLFPSSLSVEKNYLELENLFLDFSARIDVRASELDAVIWHEMAHSPLTVRHLMDQIQDQTNGSVVSKRTKKSKQLQLLLPV